MNIGKLSQRHIGIPLSLSVLYALIIGSLLIEYFGGHTLSSLCLFERYCLIVILVLVTLAYFFQSFYKNIIDQTCVLLCLNTFVSFYHLLIQHRILPEPDFCKKAIPINTTFEEMEEIIRQNAISSCTNLGPSIHGVSYDAVICVASFFLFIYLSFVINKGEDGEGDKEEGHGE